MQDDMANTKGLTCIEEFIPLDLAYNLFPPHRKDHRHQMLKALNRTHRKVIYTSGNAVSLPAKERLVETKLVRLSPYRFSSEINIYGNKVAIIVFEKKPLGLIIEADEIAESLRSIFYLAWKRGGNEKHLR